MKTHHKKIYPEYFQPLIEGKKPFEIRENDENYQPGDLVLLREYEGSITVPACPDRELCWNNDENWHKEEDDDDYFEKPEDCRRGMCKSYTKELYTGRYCLIKIKDVYDLTKAGLNGYVAYTFDIRNIRDNGKKYEKYSADTLRS